MISRFSSNSKEVWKSSVYRSQPELGKEKNLTEKMGETGSVLDNDQISGKFHTADSKIGTILC